jgi:hypothetical protein
MAYTIAGLDLRGKSRIIESLGIARPECRVRLIDTGAMQHVDNDEDMCPIKFTKYEFYSCRPAELEDLSLARFVR